MFRKICNFLLGVLIIGLLVIAGLLLVPRLLGMQSLAVLSGSMEPEISVGSIVYAEPVEPESLEVGDVITYQLGEDTRVTHRITEINEEEQTFITKGDANDNVDGLPVPYSNVVGQVKYHVPYLGYISIYIKTPLGIAVGCGILIVIILLNFLPDIFSSEEEKKEKKK